MQSIHEHTENTIAGTKDRGKQSPSHNSDAASKGLDFLQEQLVAGFHHVLSFFPVEIGSQET